MVPVKISRARAADSWIQGIFPQNEGAGGRDVVGKRERHAAVGVNINVSVAVDHAVDVHVRSGVNLHRVIIENGELKDRDLP